MFETTFSEHNKIWGHKKLGRNCPRMPPFASGLLVCFSSWCDNCSSSQ